MNTPLLNNLEAKDLLLSLFGDTDKMDCWLNNMADQVAPLAGVIFPSFFTSLTGHKVIMNPKEALSELLDKLQDLGIWEYRLECRNGFVRVFDCSTGHLIEEVEHGSLSSLLNKYGKTLRSN